MIQQIKNKLKETGKVHCSLTLLLDSGVRGGGAVTLPPPYERPPEMGGGALLIFTFACIFLPQAIYILHCIAMHCTHPVIE